MDCFGWKWEVVAVVHPGGPDVLMLMRVEDGVMGWGSVVDGSVRLERVG